MSEETRKPYLRFEFITDFGYKTIMEKEFEYEISEAQTIVSEFRNFMLACGFQPGTVDKYIIEELE